jgi:hypothetical protein
MTTPAQRDALQDLADTVWAERRLVEFLLFKLITAKLLLAADESRFVTAAIDEVNRAVDALRAAEVHRSAALQHVGDALGRDPDDLPLATLAATAPAPFDVLFRDHLQALHRLTDEVERTARQNSQLASAALNHVHASMAALHGADDEPTLYDARGRGTHAGARVRALDEVL